MAKKIREGNFENEYFKKNWLINNQFLVQLASEQALRKCGNLGIYYQVVFVRMVCAGSFCKKIYVNLEKISIRKAWSYLKETIWKPSSWTKTACACRQTFLFQTYVLQAGCLPGWILIISRQDWKTACDIFSACRQFYFEQ